tara:strand:- start:156 stop:1193 length:1038 start_codon:yes stop_codon:yes gene_type:complete
MLVNDIFLIEANVEPKALAWIDKYVKDLKPFLQDENPSINHDAFLKRLKKDIINNKPTMYPRVDTPLIPYKPKKTDPDYIKNATDPVYTIDKDFFTDLDDELQSLYSSGERDDLPAGKFYKFHDLVKDPDLDPALKNKLLPLKKKYEQGKFDFPGLEDAMDVMAELGAQRWKHDKVERKRLETEAPVIMKFDDGFMWVRLDSQEEFEREGDMLQNCLHGYCPVEVDDPEIDDNWQNDPALVQMPPAARARFMAREQLGNLVYSLRDENGNSHVAIEYHHDAPDEVDVKGKQNADPDEKYNKYMVALGKHWKENPKTFGAPGNSAIAALLHTESADLNRIKHLAGV